jgi:hypothetical protein
MSYIGNEPTSVAFLTDTFSGNGSTTAFTLSAAPATTSSILVAITGVLQDPSTYSVSGTTLTFSPAPPTGTSNISVRFLGIPASGVTTTAYRTVTEFTATSGQTTFSVPSYTVGFIDVYRNGVLLGSADYTASNGLSVVLVNGCTAGDLVEVISFQVSSVLNAIPATTGAVGASNLASGSVTSAKIASGQTFALNGVQFPATQVPSADANTLDDYEEGSFTPAIQGSSSAGTFTYNTASTFGRYVKVGSIVHFQLSVVVNAGSGASGDTFITGLPFTVRNFTNYFPSAVVGYFQFATTGWTQYDQSAILSPNTNRLTIYYAGNNGSIPTGATVFNGGSNIYISGSYLTDN